MLNLLGALAIGASIGFVFACFWLAAFDRRDQMLADSEADVLKQLPEPD